MDFQDLLAQTDGLGAKYGTTVTLINSSLLLELLLLCHFWRKSIKKCERESADRQTDTLCDGDKLNL